jgi:hypothetical protein
MNVMRWRQPHDKLAWRRIATDGVSAQDAREPVRQNKKSQSKKSQGQQ